MLYIQINYFGLFLMMKCNSTGRVGVCKKARVQSCSSQAPLKVSPSLFIFFYYISFSRVVSSLYIYSVICYCCLSWLSVFEINILLLQNNCCTREKHIFMSWFSCMNLNQVRKEKLSDRITTLHQLVSPFGKVTINQLNYIT